MKRNMATALLAASAFFAMPAEASDPRWAYVYVDDSQNLIPDQPVDWGFRNNGVFSNGVFIKKDDTQAVIIKNPGVYLVTYITTVRVVDDESMADDGDAQFALYLNNEIVDGSIYGTGNAYSDLFISAVFNSALDNDVDQDYDAQSQIRGQVIFRVREEYSRLCLRNHCENELNIDNSVGTDTTSGDPDFWGNNVSASMIIQRIDKHHHD